MDGYALSEMLRTTGGLYLSCRRGIVLTSFVGILSMMTIALYQIGIVSRLPQLPWSRFRTSQIAAVAPAFRPLGLPIPDSFLGLMNYAVTATLAGFAGPDRYQHLPWIVFLLAAKVLADATLGGILTWIQWRWYGAFCMYCLIAALASFVAVPLMVPEFWAALKSLRT